MARVVNPIQFKLIRNFVMYLERGNSQSGYMIIVEIIVFNIYKTMNNKKCKKCTYDIIYYKNSFI